uniref:Serine/threonine-protein phosphatase n=1 Tax=Romanomermis culicivorax TaxID=13658 RepID=A0A915KNI4_ROMCU
MKARYPTDFFVLRGNHETAAINYHYGFFDEVTKRYSKDLWFRFQFAFDSLPIAALVANKLFCMHGGLSPELKSFSQIQSLALPFTVPDTTSLIGDILWSDPCGEVK